MRRAKRLFERLVERENLMRAFHRAARARRDKAVVQNFAADLETQIAEMQAGLCSGTYPVGQFHQFLIRDPKSRVITAPVFAERVLHHGVMNVLEPVLDRWLIDDTFACRTGRGREIAVARAQKFCAGGGWFLKLDVRKYFDSIPHARLLDLLQRKLGDRRLLELLQKIIRGFRGNVGIGLPIGSLTSQHFANLYLDGLDRFVKEGLRVRRYVRYMDDMVLWHDSRKVLCALHGRVREFASGQLDLQLKPATVQEVDRGVPFLGCTVFRTHTVLSRKSRVRWRRRLKILHQAHRLGVMSELELQQRLTALTAFAKSADAQSWLFRSRVLQCLSVNDR